jgi:hypothetical protein
VPAGTEPPYKTTLNNFAPRVGVAYQVRQSPRFETVVRGGFGVFYDLNSETYADGLAGIENVANFSALPFPVAPSFLPVPPLPPPNTPPFQSVNAFDPNLQLPYTLQWNASIEQALGGKQSLSVSYVAAAGYRLLRTDQLFNLSPTIQNVEVLRNASSSNYQSLQLQFNRRLSHGLQALASYTYSHSIDDASGGEELLSSSLTGASFPNPSIDRGNSDFDLRHAFRGAFTYTIPAWNATVLSRAILGGWSVDPIGIIQTGLPVDLIGGEYFPPDAYELILRPNVVPDQPFYLYGAQCASLFQASGALAPGQPCPGGRAFNPAAFTPVPQDANGNPILPPGTINGNLNRNVLRGFGLWQIDFAIHRQFNLTERVNLQFRSEFFNVFNHPNFSGVNNFVGQGTFGLAQSTVATSYGNSGALNSLYAPGGPRSIQFALKLAF